MERSYRIDPAHPMRRIYAIMLDFGILIPMFIGLNLVTQGHIAHQNAAAQDIMLYFAYFVFPTGIWGGTPGKIVAGIIVVNEDGRIPGVATAIGREMAFKAVSSIIFVLGLLWILFDTNRRGWHDHMAGTFVVKKLVDMPASGSDDG